MVIIDFIVNQVLRELSIFLGLVTLIGCIFLKKTGREVMVSTVKSIVGVRILQVGTTTLVEASRPMMNMLIASTGLEGRVADAWVGVGEILERLPLQLAGQVGLLMMAAWLLHILFARLSPFKVIYLTMHLAFINSVWVLWGVYAVTGWEDYRAFILAAVLLAISWTIFPYLIRFYLKPITGKDRITIGHDTMIGGIAAGLLAGIVGKSRSAEELPLPGWLSIFKENAVSYGVVMAIIYTLIGVISGPEVGAQFSNGANYLMFSFMQGVTVAAGLLVLVAGVKMSLAELLPAFEGFAGKVVPGAIPGVDVPAIISYRPQAALIGFLATLGGMAVGIVIQVVSGFSYVIIPSVIPIFFGGSLYGVIADARAGWRGILVVCFILGVVLILGAAVYAQVVDMRIAAAGNVDYIIFWLPIFAGLKALFGS